MPAWFRKIRRINIFGFELEFDHSAGEPAKPVEDRAPTSINRRRPDPPVPANASPARLTVYGEVIGAIGKDLGLRIRNENEAQILASPSDRYEARLGRQGAASLLHRQEARLRELQAGRRGQHDRRGRRTGGRQGRHQDGRIRGTSERGDRGVIRPLEVDCWTDFSRWVCFFRSSPPVHLP